MRILMTGASSFTGYHLVKGLLKSHQLTCTFRRYAQDYSGIYRQRVQEIVPFVRPVYGAFGSDAFIQAIEEADLIFHHGACVDGYNSLSFSEDRAVAENTHRLDLVMRHAQRYSCRVVLTQSIFEREPFSPYSRSKKRTTQAFVQAAAKNSVSLKRLIMPNPIGVMSNEKLLFYLIKTWSAEETAFIRNPKLVRDNLPVDLLVQCVLLWLNDDRELLEPSGYCASNESWINLVASQCRKRCRW